MLTGWVPKFKVDRYLCDHERVSHLSPEGAQKFSPDDAIGMISFNGAFI